MPERKTKKQVSFRYKIAQNYAVYSISGVHGGPNAQGDIIASFWSERAPIPRKQVYELTPEGQLGEQIGSEVEDSLIRDVIFGVAMEPHVARAIGQWLIEKADDHEKKVAQHIKGQSNG